MSCVRLIDAERATFSGPLMCHLLEASCSGYYGWRDRWRRELERTLPSPARSAGSTSVAEAPTAFRGYTPSMGPLVSVAAESEW